MDYKATLSPNGDYVLVRVLKDVTTELAFRFLKDGARLGEEHDLRKMLVDERGAPSKTSVLEKYTFAHERKDVPVTRDWRIAMIKDPDNKAVDFLETVMLNAGYTFRIFINENQAITWLLKPTPS